MIMDDVFYEVLLHKAILTVSEVVSILRISTYRVYKLIHQGKLIAYKEDGCGPMSSLSTN